MTSFIDLPVAALIPSPPRGVTHIAPTASVRDALRLMAREHVSTLPVISHNDPRKIVSIIGGFDLVIYVIGFNDASVGTDGEARRVWLNRCEERLSRTVEAVMTLDANQESYLLRWFDRHQSVRVLLQSFGHRRHRVLVNDAMDAAVPVAMLTQADVIRFLYNNPVYIPSSLARKTLAELGLVSGGSGPLRREPVSVTDWSSALTCFSVMAQHRLTSLPIVSSHGRIVGNLRAVDTMAMVGRVDTCMRGVLDYLRDSDIGLREPVMASSEMLFTEALEMMVHKQVHHVWLVDSDERCVGAVSMTDLCRIVLHAKTK